MQGDVWILQSGVVFAKLKNISSVQSEFKFVVTCNKVHNFLFKFSSTNFEQLYVIVLNLKKMCIHSNSIGFLIIEKCRLEFFYYENKQCFKTFGAVKNIRWQFICTIAIFSHIKFVTLLCIIYIYWLLPSLHSI